MQTFLLVLLAVAALATVVVLVRGVIGMAQQKDLSGVRSQQLMRKRVTYQAAAIFIAVLVLLLAGS